MTIPKHLIVLLTLCIVISTVVYADQTEIDSAENNFDTSSMRIVCLTASTCEILYALGAGDTIVGRGEYCDYPEEIKTIPAINSGDNTNIEQIIALSPDIVFMSTMAQSQEQVDALKKLGLPVMVTDAQTIEETYESIELIGSAIGKEEKAAELITEMKAIFSEIATKATDNMQGEKSIYFEVSPLEWGIWTAGANTFMDEIAQMLGLKNIFSDIDGWAEVSQEQIIDRNPDYIITITMYYGEDLRSNDEIMTRAGWQDITAVQKGTVFYLDSDEISRPGPRLANAATDLYALIYESQE